MKSYASLSIAQLEAEIARLDGDLEAIRVTKRAAAAALDEKLVMAEALRKLEQMSDAERVALSQVLNPDGIASEERMGIVGRLRKALGV